MIRLTCIFLLMGNLCFGQSDFITWRIQTASKKGKEVSLLFKASLTPGWHLYSQFIAEGGPQPTKFSFDKNDAFKLIGSVSESGKTHKFYDELYEMNVTFFEDSVEFVQQVRTIRSSKDIKGRIDFMICNSEVCIPRKQDFNILLPNNN